MSSLMSNSVEGEIMDLDLNEEPSSDSESPTGFITELSPWLNELETAHERIEERIRQLEAIISRIREQESTRTTTTTTTQALVQTNEHRDSTAGVIHERSRERLVENGDNKTYLIAKALNMEKASSVPGGYFDCNICLEKAIDPILTCCGHLFCWGCFYQLPMIYLNIKECPVCDGEVTDSQVIPIYGNGGDSDGTKPKFEDCGISLPPRPNAKRVESIRQKIINRAIPLIPVHETIEHIRRTIDSIGLQALAQGEEFGLRNIITNGDRSRLLQQQQQQQHHHHHQPFGPLRLLPPNMTPFASFPGPEVDDTFDVDSFVDTTSLRRNGRRSSSRTADPGPSPAVRASHRRNRSNNASSQTISVRLGSAASSSATEFAVPSSSTVMTRSQTVNPTEVVTSVASASSSRRRTEDVNNGPRTRSRRRLR